MAVTAALASPTGPGTNSSAVASATNTCSTGTFTRDGGPLNGMFLLAAYNGDFTTNPATDASFGGSPLTFLVGQTGAATNCSVEVWGQIQLPNSGVGTINFAGGTLNDIIVFLIELDRVGQPAAPNSGANSGNGTTSPLTVSLVTVDAVGSRKGTTTVQAADSILIGIGCMFKGASLSQLSQSAGNVFHTPINAGAGGTLIQAGTAWLQGTGGSDTIAWTESLNREWAEATIQVSGAGADGMILRPGGLVLPNLF